MPTTKELLAQRAAHQERMDEIVNRVHLDRRTELNAAESAEYRSHKDARDKIDRTPDLPQTVGPEPLRRGDGTDALSLGYRRGGGDFGEVRAGMPLTKEQRFEDYCEVRGLVPEGQHDLSLRKWLRGAVTGDWSGAPDEMRAMSVGTLSAGGYMVPSALSARVIDRARNISRVLAAGATVIPMESSTLKVARVATDPSTGWHSENATITPTDAVLEEVLFTARTLTGIVQVSRELIEDAEGLDDEVTRIFAEVLANKIDLACLYGSGTPPEPTGVKLATGVTLTSLGAAGLSLATTSYAAMDWLSNAVGTLQDNNFEPTAILYSPRTARGYGKLRDTTGQPVRFPPYVDSVPRLPTNQIPNDLVLTTSSDCSDIFVGAWAELLLGVRTTFALQVLSERYADTGSIGLMCWWRGDVQLARPKAFNVVSGVRP